MSKTLATASKWICDGCSMSAGRIDGGRMALPDSWVATPEGRFCLVCQRERAANAALDAAPPDSSLDARAKLRRAAVIEFEVLRTPDHTNGMIAKACRSSATAVAKARDRLQLPDATGN